MRVLGIETTCDETAVAVVSERLGGEGGEILSNEVLSQIARHAAYGGVVPEIAARAHIDVLDRLIRRALERAKTEAKDLDGIAAAAGPGLIGGVLVGLTAGKAMALALGKPFIAVNHLEAHALTARLTDRLDFPFLALLISGGHTQIVAVKAIGDYRRLGSTVDDAAGEAFDKVAKMLELPYPGGPQIEKLALEGDARRFDFPRPMLGREGADFSLSGLKTAVRQEILKTADAERKGRQGSCSLFPSCDRRRDRGQGALRRAPLYGRRGASPARPRDRRRGRGQRRHSPRAYAALRRKRAAVHFAAGGALRRQWRDHRLDRSRALKARIDR